jgi:bis(5'-adenosyl)-triphosphatase
MVERVYGASSLNIAVQDGIDAGQSVPHVHTHIIPRKKADLDDYGGPDAIYGMMDGLEGDIGEQLRNKNNSRSNFPRVDSDERKPRSEQEMVEEARILASAMDREPAD